MAADKPLADDELLHPFEWGGTVRVVRRVQEKYSMQLGSVCGFRIVTDERSEYPAGTMLLLIEGENGIAVEIPIEDLDASSD